MIEETNTHSISVTAASQFRVLNATDAVLVWVMKWAGDADHVIAYKLGTMPSRVSSVLSETTHVGSRDRATKMVTPRDT